jgi:hypothetical protein
MYYGARWYDSYLNRWIQPDSIIPDPGNSTDLDRYAYARNNPTNYVDPLGTIPIGVEGTKAVMHTITHKWDMGIVTLSV